MSDKNPAQPQNPDLPAQAPQAPQALFRSEVTAAHSQQWLGAIRLAQPISGWLVAGVAVVVTSALVSFITFGNVTKKARVTGVTLPIGGSLSVVAPNTGLLVKSMIAEGQQVQAGQVLFELSTERQGDQGEITALVAQQLATRQHSLEAEGRLRLAQYQDKKQSLTERISNLQTEAAQLEQEIVLTQRRQALALETLSKFQTLQTNGYVSGAQTQQKQEDSIDIATRLSNLQRNKLQLQANLLGMQADQTALANSLASDQAQLQSSVASLQQEIAENHNRKASLITASQAGTITTLAVQTGQMMNAGQVVATLIPNSSVSTTQIVQTGQTKQTSNNNTNPQLEAYLYAPSRTAGFVAKGQTVLIRYQAYPYQKFGLQRGTVIDVSKTPFAPNELPVSLASTILSNAQQNILGFNSNEALYRIKVKLDKQSIDAYGQAQTLKPGMTLEADVLQDNRKIWEWILEPVLAAAKTI
jgi:membrane fusion protein